MADKYIFFRDRLISFITKKRTSGRSIILVIIIVLLNSSAVSQTINLDSLLTAEEIGWLNKNGIILLLSALLIITFFLNRTLKKRLGKRTLQLRKANDIASKNAQQYRIIAEDISDVVWLSDFNFNVTYVSPSVEKVFGYTPSDYLKKKIEDRIPAKYLEKLTTILDEELENENKAGYSKNRSRILELEHYHANGKNIWIELNVSFIREITGQPTGIHFVARDVSERIKAEKYINKRLAMENLLSKISEKAIGESNIEVILQKMLRETGLTMDISRTYIFECNRNNKTVSNTFEWCASNVAPRIDDMQQQPFGESSWVYKELKKGRNIKFKNISKLPDEFAKQILRRYNVVSLLIVPLMLNNRLYGFMGFEECRKTKKWCPEDVKALQSLAFIVTSLIERHKTDRELTIKDRSIELSLVGKAISDLQGKITYANKTFLKYWRYHDIHEVLNKTVYDFWESGDDSVKVIAAIRESGSWQGELKGIRADGTVFDALVQASLVTSKEGKP
ncbi:MAG: PAS domain S-box protein, partial [Bacteroidota bacterium]